MDLLADFLHFGASDFPFKNPFKKCFKIVFFSLWRRDPGFGATISDAIARSSLVFCNSVSADRIGMAASRLLLALAACVMLLQLDLVNRGSEMDLLADFLHFGASVFCCSRFRAVEVWGVESAVWSVQCEGSSGKCMKCGVWSLSLECEERSVKCEVWSVWSVQCEGSSGKWEVWSVECEV